MRYLCLVYFEPEIFGTMTEEQKRKLDEDSLAYDRELERLGHMVAAEALRSVSDAVTVKVRGGSMSTRDGPFAETKEHLGGFILVEARDLNEAIRIAAGVPLARLGTIEVRPVMVPWPEPRGPA